MELNFTFGAAQAAPPRARRKADEPFRLLLVGDFSGRAWKAARGEVAPLTRPLELDAEAFDRAFAACNVTLPVDAGAGETVVSFDSLDDLHPDRLLARLAELAEPRRLRADLAGVAPGADTLAAVERWLTTHVNLVARPPNDTGAPPAATATSAAASLESADAAVERLLGRAPRAADPSGSTAGAGRADAGSALGSLIASIVQPHVTPDPGPRRAQLLLALDEVIAARLRAILAAPSFRALEGAWRGVDRVVRALGTDAELQISLLDASRRDLFDAVSGGADGDLEASPLHRLLVADSDDRRFSLVAVDFAVALAGDDLRLCAALGAVVGRGGGALVAGAAPSLLGCDTLDAVADPTLWRSPDQAPDGALWRALRESPLAPSIRLALPRVLARLPYGSKTDPIESFPFEEVSARTGRAPDARVWSPAAFAIAEATGAAFRAGGLETDPSGMAFDLDDLPAHTYDDNGETRLFAPAEVVLSERAGAAVVASGLTAILARRDRGAARILGASSIVTAGTD